jgi:hypothetical protein
MERVARYDVESHSFGSKVWGSSLSFLLAHHLMAPRLHLSVAAPRT